MPMACMPGTANQESHTGHMHTIVLSCYTSSLLHRGSDQRDRALGENITCAFFFLTPRGGYYLVKHRAQDTDEHGVCSLQIIWHLVFGGQLARAVGQSPIETWEESGRFGLYTQYWPIGVKTNQLPIPERMNYQDCRAQILAGRSTVVPRCNGTSSVGREKCRVLRYC